MRKNNYRLFLLVGLVFFLSIGYAVVSSVNLTISGSSSAGTSALDVAFTNNYSVSNTSKGSASINPDGQTATFNATNLSLNETITFTYNIKNNETDVAAAVTLSTSGSNNYFTISVSNTNFVLDPGESTPVVVSITMIKTPVLSNDNTANLEVTINAIPTEYSNLINFTIDGVPYQAEKNMLWEDWVYSEYNTGNFSIFDPGYSNSIINESGKEVMDRFNSVKSYEFVMDGVNYTFNDVSVPM